MERNSVRTSAELATLASNLLAGRRMEEFGLEVQSVLDALLIEELAKRLAGSVLSNRRE